MHTNVKGFRYDEEAGTHAAYAEDAVAVSTHTGNKRRPQQLVRRLRRPLRRALLPPPPLPPPRWSSTQRSRRGGHPRPPQARAGAVGGQYL